MRTAEGAAPAFELDHVGYRLGDEILIEDVCLALHAGSMNVLLGPTLSGKTTLMRQMAGLDHPSSGLILEAGRDVTGVAVRQRSVTADNCCSDCMS